MKKTMTQLEKGKVFHPNAVIDYADGGIVSKEFIHTNGGSVTLFSFDQGQSLSEHSAPFDAMVRSEEHTSELQSRI